jgi:hypothetical protein
MPFTMNYSAPDLTQHPPRSVRVRLGGYVLLPRMIDKCRAELAGKNGPYHYNCPLDQRLLAFAGVDADAFKAEVAKGKGDGELLTWFTEHQKHKRSDWEVSQWSTFRETAAPGDNESRQFVGSSISEAGLPHREDIATWFEWLDADDFASYGGKA